MWHTTCWAERAQLGPAYELYAVWKTGGPGIPIRQPCCQDAAVYGARLAPDRLPSVWQKRCWCFYSHGVYPQCTDQDGARKCEGSGWVSHLACSAAMCLLRIISVPRSRPTCKDFYPSPRANPFAPDTVQVSISGMVPDAESPCGRIGQGVAPLARHYALRCDRGPW